MIRRARLNGLVLLVPLCLVALRDDTSNSPHPPEPETITLQGKVLPLGQQLKAWGLAVDDDQAKSAMVLVTPEGEVYPILKNQRSRGFFMDPRLQDRPVEFVVYKYPGLPYIRLVNTYSFKDGVKCYLDYWCEVCSIVTFEPGPCPCCQDDVELRERPVK